MFPIPKRVFLTRGVGVHRQQLAAFEYALRDADIEQQNLVSVSSILPPQCELIPRQVGVAALSPGEITFCVLARAETNESGRLVTAGISLARPKIPHTTAISLNITDTACPKTKRPNMLKISQQRCWPQRLVSTSARMR